jgi:hypothetical protein
MVGGKAMIKSVGEMDARIAAAFTDGVTSQDVGRLLVEVEAAANAADAVATEARTGALDPLLSRDDVNGARREMDDAKFTRERLTEAARRLGERLVELRALEKARTQRAEHERVQAERDRLAAELDHSAEPIAKIGHLVAQIDACDREIRNLNATSGKDLGHIRPVLAGAAPVIVTLLGDGVAWDAFMVVARLQYPPVTKGKANAP